MSHSRTALSISLFLLLVATYLIFFRGTFVSTDEMFLFDMTESFARRGNFDETITYYLAPLRPASEDKIFRYDESYEPLQPILASPLFMLADHTENLNLVHVVWLFNVVVVALTSVAFFWGVLALGYDTRIAWYSALLLGLGTLLMPYSRTFFREPLMTLFTTVAISATLTVQRTNTRTPWRAGAVMLVAFGLAFATKGIAVLFLPAIALLLFRGKWRDWLLVVVGGLGIITLLFLLEETGRGGTRFTLSRWIDLVVGRDWAWVPDSFGGYLYSPGRSLFWFSPILVLSPWGMWLLWKRGDWRLVLSMIGLFVAFAAGYGLLREEVWTGGISLGPRYLLPLAPLFGFTIPPILAHTFQSGQNRWLQLVVFGVAALSIGIQMLFSTYSELQYYQELAALNDPDLGAQNPWDIQRSPFIYYAEHLSADTLNVIWRYSDWWPLLVGGFGLVILIELVATGRQLRLMPAGRMAFSASLLVILAALGLRNVGDDPRFMTEGEQSIPLLDRLATLSDPNDAVILGDGDFVPLFAAKYKDADFMVSLPIPPGEKYSEGHVAVVEDGTTSELAGEYIVRVDDYIAQHYDRAWLIARFGPFHTFARRPAERYLVENYFRFQESELRENLRIIGFYMKPAPHGAPANPLDVLIGDQFWLQGYDLIAGDTYGRGDVIPVSLLLTIQAPIDRDYTFSVQLVTLEGQVVAQQDGLPVGGFERTSTWPVGASYRDSRGVLIPDDLPLGTYQLQMIIYYWENLERLPVLDRTSGASGDIVPLQSVTVR